MLWDSTAPMTVGFPYILIGAFVSSPAGFAAAEYGGPAFGGSGAEYLYAHELLS